MTTVYKASAGSGKTFTLSAEYIAYLLSGDTDAHKRQLAVTFTNKATGEMKERILQYLYDIAHSTDPEPDDFLKAVKAHLAETAKDWPLTMLRKRAADMLAAILHDYDQFHVKTIDSFFQVLLSSLSHELGLSSNFRVQLGDDEIVDRAVDRIMERVGLNAPEDAELVKIVNKYVHNRIDDKGSWDISHEVKALGQEVTKDDYRELAKEIGADLADKEKVAAYRKQMIQIRKQAAEDIRNAAASFDEGVSRLFGSYEAISYGKNRLWPYVNKCLNLEPGDKDYAGEPNSTVVKYTKEPELWVKAADKKKHPEYQTYAEELCGILADMEDVRKNAVIALNSAELCLKNLNPLQLLGEIQREIDVINQEQNHFMLADTPRLFKSLIKDCDAPFVMERAGTQFDHVMIDEFQDTAPVQWATFNTLLKEKAAAGQSCLLVGDVKQSIYGWRGGDWRLLLEQARKAEKEGRIRPLSVNYRSGKVVIDFNNETFLNMAKALDQSLDCPDVELQSFMGIYNDVEQEPNNDKGGYVRVDFHDTKSGKKKDEDADNEEEEQSLEEKVAEQIHRLHDKCGVPYGEMAILVRNNKDIANLMKFFTERPDMDIPMVSNDCFLLEACPQVQRLVCALKALRDRRRGKRIDAISKTLLEDGGELPKEFVEGEKELLTLSLYELCERLVALFDLNTVNALPYLNSFMDHVMDWMGEYSSSLDAFCKFWDESLHKKSIPAENIDAVTVLTIHKSKGLAYHTVFVPYCNWPSKKGKNTDTIWCKPTVPPFDGMKVLPMETTKKMEDSIFRADYLIHKRIKLIEEINALYVAFTRTKKNLFVWVPFNDSIDKVQTVGEAMQLALAQVGPAIREYGHLEEYVKKTAKESQNPLEFKAECLEMSPESQTPRYTFRQSRRAAEYFKKPEEENARAKQYLEEGTLLHDIFSRIYRVEDIEPALKSAVVEGLLTQEKADELRPLVTSRVTSPKSREWFSSRWRVYNEQSIVCRDRKTGLVHQLRPDRVMTDGERTVVVDFKFASPKPEYVEQVQQYCKLLSEMGHRHVSGYLWFVYRNEIVEI